MSLTFVTPNEMDYLHEIEKLTRVRMLPLKPPTAEEAFRGQVASAFNDIDELIAQDSTDRYRAAAEKLLETHNATDLVAALLNDMTKEAASEVPVKITPERPLPRRNRHGRGNNYHHGGNHYRRNGQYKNGGYRRHSRRSDNHGKSHSSRHSFNIRHRKED